MQIAKRSVFVFTLLCFFLLPICITGRLCCDPQCRKPISYARTNTRNVKREPGRVLYSAGAVTTVLSKAVGMENEVELWEVEILGSKGLILSSALNEISVMCETQNLVKVPDANSQVEQASKTLQQPITQDGGEHIRQVETFIPQSTTDTVGTSGNTVHPSPVVPLAMDTPKPEENLGTQVYQQEEDLNGKTVVHDNDIRYNGGQTHNERDIPNKESSPSINVPNGQMPPNGRNIPPNGASPFPTASLLDQLQGDGSPVVEKPGPPPPKLPEHVQRWREQQLHQQQQQVTPSLGEESHEGETHPVGADGFGDIPRTDSPADAHGHDHENEMKETDGVLEASPEVRVDQQKFEQPEEDIWQDHGSQFQDDWSGEEPGFQEELELRIPEEGKAHQNEEYTADPDQGSKTIIEEQPPSSPPAPPTFTPVPSQTTPIAWGSSTEDLMESRDLNIKPSPLELLLEEKEEDDVKITLRSGKKAKVSVREDGRIDVLLDDGTHFDVPWDYFDDLEEDILDFIDERLLYDYDIDLENEDEEVENQDEDSKKWDEESDHWNEYRSEEPEDKHDKKPDTVSPDSIPSIPDSFPEHEHEPEPKLPLHSPAQPSDGSGHYTARNYLNLDAIRERAEKNRHREQGEIIDEVQDAVDLTHDSGLKDATRSETIFSTTMSQFDSVSGTPDGHPVIAPDEGLPGSAGGEATTAQDSLPRTASEPADNFEGNTSGAFHEQDNVQLTEVPHKPEATAPPVEPWVDQTTPPPESLYDDVTPPSIEEEEVDRLPYEEETPPTISPPPDETPPPLFKEQEEEEFDGLPFGEPFGEPPHTPGTRDFEKTGFIGILASFLPTLLADWLMAQGPETGLVAVMATSLAVLIPMCCSYCSARKDSRKKTRMLREQKTSRYQLEEQLKKLKEEHASLADRVREIENKNRGTEMELRGERETNAELEAHNQSLAASLAAFQEQTSQYQSHMEQLNTQLAQEQSQLTAQLQEREITLQQLSHLTTQLEEAGQRASEGEAARDQLEREVFSVRDRLQELEGRHLQATKEHEESEERCSQLESQMARTQDELASLRETLTEKEQELKTLTECLQEVTHGLAEAEDKEGAETGSSGESSRPTEAQLARIQAMLDTTRVQRELNAMTGERDQLAKQQRGHISKLEQLQDDVATLKAQVHSLTEEKQRIEKLHETTESKLKTLTDFFEQQSQTLHRQRFQEEVNRQTVETREARAVEQATAFEEERLREKEELKELRKQMAEIEMSLMQQVLTNEKRAQEAQAQLRRTEQDLRQANREVTILKRSLAESMDDRARALVRPEQRPGPRGPRLRPRSPPPPGRSASGYGPPYLRPRPPSTGPPVTRLPPRPLSTTRLPRTSSPGPESREPSEQEKVPLIGSSASQPILNTSQPPPAPPQSDNRQLSQSFDIPRRPVDETDHHAVTKGVDSTGPSSSESQLGSQHPQDGTRAQPRYQPPQDGSRLQPGSQRPLDGSRSPRPLAEPRPYHPSYGVPPPGNMPPRNPPPFHMAPPRPPMGVPPPPRPRDYRPAGRGFPPMDRRHPPPPGPGPVSWDRRRPPMGPSPSGEYFPPELRGNVTAGPPPMVPSGAAGSIHRPIPQNPNQEPQQRTLLSHSMTGFSHVPQQPTSQSTTSLGQGDPQLQQQISSGAPSTTGASSTVYGQSAV